MQAHESVAAPRQRIWLLGGLAATATLGVVLLRFYVLRDVPLWLDETFTAVITGQPTFARFVQFAHRDVGAPLYYLLLWVLPGESNFALRLPSLALMVAAAILPLVWRIPGQSRPTAVTWATLLLLWAPGGELAFNARPYALMFFLATAQTIAFARVLETPTLGRAFAWTSLGALSILTHYFSGMLGLAQGLLLIALLGKRSFRLMPALIALLPAFVEFAVHLPLLMKFASGDANWLPRFGLRSAESALAYMTGSYFLMKVFIAGGSRLAARNEEIATAALPPIVSAIAAALLLMMLGWDRSFLTERYFTACVPGIQLGFATFAAGLAGRLFLIVVYGAIAVQSAITDLPQGWGFGVEAPARHLIPLEPREVVYSLGYLGQHTLPVELQHELGEFHFRRAGLATKASLIATSDGRQLVRAAPHDAAIMWIFDDRTAPVAREIARERTCWITPYNGGGTLACAPLGSQRS